MKINELDIYQLKHWIEALRIVNDYKKLTDISPNDDELIATLKNTLEEKENENIYVRW